MAVQKSHGTVAASAFFKASWKSKWRGFSTAISISHVAIEKPLTIKAEGLTKICEKSKTCLIEVTKDDILLDQRDVVVVFWAQSIQHIRG